VSSDVGKSAANCLAAVNRAAKLLLRLNDVIAGITMSASGSLLRSAPHRADARGGIAATRFADDVARRQFGKLLDRSRQRKLAGDHPGAFGPATWAAMRSTVS